MRWVELVATDSFAIFEATSAHQWISCSAEAAPVAPGTSLFSGVTVNAPARIFNMLNICLRRALVATERKRRNRRRGGLLPKTIRAESQGAHCVSKRHLWSCGLFTCHF